MNTIGSAKSKFLDRTTPPHMVTLVLTAGLGASAMSLFLPSLNAMTAYFDTEYAVMQLAVSAFLALTGALQLIIGPLADLYGRRPILLVCGSIFCLATLGCILAPTIEIFLACRFLQAAAAAGTVLSRAIVRDMFPAEQAASRLAYVTMGMALIPMAAPVIGGTLQELFGWKAAFTLLLAIGIVVLAVQLFDLKETNPVKRSSFRAQVAEYPQLLRSRRFWGYNLSAAFGSGCFFAFLGGGPYVAEQVLGMRPSAMGLAFGTISCGYLFGNMFSGRYALRFGLFPMMLSGAIIATLGMLVSLTLYASGFDHPVAVFGPVFFVGFGNGLTLPSSNAGLLSVRPDLAGTASGLGGAVMIGGGAGIAAITGALLGNGLGAYPLILMMLASASCGILAALYTHRIEMQIKRRQAADA